ncbi:MAG: PEPxxWA-CTERM sorting domain-containing protein [Phenylobacterium sp.]|nr:PEPxxWA-CTERM sorting domain-containing protein [Phenylobacterium sp.]
MNLGRVGAAMALAGALLAPGAAQAAKYRIIYTGVLKDWSYDQTGVFGTPDTFLDGEAFKATFLLTWPSPGADYRLSPGSAFAEGGATILGGVPGIVSAQITIKNVTKSVSGEWLSFHGRRDSATGDSFSHYADEVALGGPRDVYYGEISMAVSGKRDLIDGLEFANPINYTRQAGDSSGGLILFRGTKSGVVYEYAEATALTVNSVTMTAAPEPSTWATMIMGFGLIGSAMRRRRATTA